MGKKIFNIIIFSFLVLLIITINLKGAESKGTSSAPFLKLGTSSRLLGRGEAFVAQVNDPSALTVNVAGLAEIEKMEILFSHYEWLLELDYEHFTFTKPIVTLKNLNKSKGVLGVGITYLHLPPFPEYNDWGENIGELSANSAALITGYGQKLYNFNVGIAFKTVYEQISDASDIGFGADFGIIYTYRYPRKFLGLPRTLGKTLKIGFSAQNITLDDGIKGYKLPATFKFGIGTEIVNDLEYEIDVEQPIDSKFRLNMGLEYNFRNYFAIRFGYRFLGYEVDTFTLGLGIRYPFDNKLVKVDASYVPEGILDNTTDISVGVKFPESISEKDWKLANMLYYKGIYYYTNGELKKAIEMWQKVLKIIPDHKKAKQKIKDAQYLLDLKKVEKEVKELEEEENK